jgi:hypothetical protein
MPTNLQTQALAAVHDAPDGPPDRRLQAVKLLRERTDKAYSMREYVEAVDWALEHRSGADLPDGSVVANDRKVWIKTHPALHYQWMTTDGTCGQNHNVDEALTNGATVLRVGTGKEG